MVKSLQGLILLAGCILLVHCKKETTSAVPNPPPPVQQVTISNLVYEPKVVPIRMTGKNFQIRGTINYSNASGGISVLRLATSAGADLTTELSSNSEASGTLTGTFEIAMPTVPVTYTFELWVIDGKGNASNKLNGSVQIIIDDSGKNWGTILLSHTLILNKIIWGNSNYMAVGHAGAIFTSDGGGTWTFRNSGTNQLLHGIAWSGEQYIVVGENNTILTSPDGITWTTRSIEDIDDYDLFAVIASGPAFIAVGQNGAKNQTEILSSIDGISWTSNELTLQGGELKAIAWSGTQYVAVGKIYTQGSYQTLVVTSPNGFDWTNRGTVRGGWSFDAVIWDGVKFVAAGSGISATSTDGITWTVNSNASVALLGITFSGNTYAGVGNGIFTSLDGLHWTQQLPDDGLMYPVRSVAWSGLQYAAVGKPGIVLVSP